MKKLLIILTLIGVLLVSGCSNGYKTTISNEELESCIKWFDGCNTCEVVDGVTSCTLKDCSEYTEPRCIEYYEE